MLMQYADFYMQPQEIIDLNTRYNTICTLKPKMSSMLTQPYRTFPRQQAFSEICKHRSIKARHQGLVWVPHSM